MIKRKCLTSEILFQDREINSFKAIYSESIGFTLEKLQSFTKSNSILNHNGCVNSVTWSKNGEKLLSGGDDRTVSPMSNYRI